MKNLALVLMLFSMSAMADLVPTNGKHAPGFGWVYLGKTMSWAVNDVISFQVTANARLT